MFKFLSEWDTKWKNLYYFYFLPAFRMVLMIRARKFVCEKKYDKGAFYILVVILSSTVYFTSLQWEFETTETFRRSKMGVFGQKYRHFFDKIYF